MVTRRRRRRTDTTFDHVVATLMNIKSKHHTYKVLRHNDISEAYEVIGLTDDMITCFVADEVDDNGKVINNDKPIPAYHQALLCILGDFFCKVKKDNGGTLTEANISSTTREEWIQFCLDLPIPVNNNAIGKSSTASNNTIPSEVKEFCKGNKRDSSQYQILKDKRQYHYWYRTVIGLAQTHQIAEVFDVTYKPSNDEEEMLFKDKKVCI
jgi:hypothetical protein